MPATSQQQQKLFGLALSVKRGETPRSEVSDEVLNIVDTMSEKKIKDFAETSHKGLPTKVETAVRNLVRETFREKVLGENKFIKPKDEMGVRTVKAIHNNINSIYELVIGKKKNPNEVLSAFSNPLINSIKQAIKHNYKPNLNTKLDKKVHGDLSNAERIKTFKGELNKILQLAEKVTKKPTVVGVKQLYMEWRGVWNHKNGAKIGLSGELYNSIIETISEAPTRRSKDFFEDTKYGIALHKLFKGKFDGNKFDKFLDDIDKKSTDVQYDRILNFMGGAVGMNIRSYNNKPVHVFEKDLKNEIEKLYKLHNESINEEEEQLDEKLITFSNRAPYGQVVFIAGGAGSGKGFAVSNFLDSAGFKVRDVDEMKKQLQRLNALGKLSIQQIIDKFGKNIKPKDLEIIKRVQDAGFDLKTMDLKNPDHVYSLHILVKAMGIKDQSLANMLGAAKNPPLPPNIMFDITAKEIGDITNVLPDLMAVGYKPNNIHLVWILTNYEMAIQQNQKRDRVVPADILLQTHIGAGNTIWGLVTKALPKGMNGRVDVVLNNQENTVFYTKRTIDKKTGKRDKAVVSGFLALPVKKQGGGILPEKVWRDILFKWVKDNGPKELTDNM
jgi:hypothetical protein